jgi:hypothetical protein
MVVGKKSPFHRNSQLVKSPVAVEKLEISTTTPDYDSYQLRLGVHPHRISQRQLCNLPSSLASFGLS